MVTKPEATAATQYLEAARGLLDRLEAQSDTIEQVAHLCFEAIAAGGLVHVFGTGHSRIPVEELFPRYGSYPGFNPLVELSMTYHTQVVGSNGQRQAMFIERVEGLAEAILANFDLAPPDAMIVFSAGGRTAVPIEIAIGAKARGLPVIAITSIAQSLAGEPTSPDRDAAARPGRPRPRPRHAGRRRARPARGRGDAGRARLHDRGGRARERRQGAHRGAARRARRAAARADERVAWSGPSESRELFDAAYAEHARRLAKVLRTRPD